MIFFFNSENKLQHDHTTDASESCRILQEKTKRGPPTNKYISVRNIKAQIANMSTCESSGFKSEYQVGIIIFVLFHY